MYIGYFVSFQFLIVPDNDPNKTTVIC